MSSRARFYAALIILSFCLSPTVTAVTDDEWIYQNYWVDDSCATQFSAAETMAQSKRGAERVADINDINDELIFQLLWHKPRTDVDTWQEVSNISRWNGGLVQQGDRDTADIRIYCDNNRGPRWQIVPDVPEEQAPPYPIWKQNSELDFGVDQAWYDPENHMRSPPTIEGCVDEQTWAWTIQTTFYPQDGSKIDIGNSLQLEDPDTPAGYQSPRAVITLCDRAFNSDYKSMGSLAIKDLSLFPNMDPFFLLPTFTLGEQIKTLAPFYKLDRQALGDLVFEGNQPLLAARSSPGSSGSEEDDGVTAWTISTGIEPEQQIVYAANFVWHDAMALLADWLWTVKQTLSLKEYQAGSNILQFSYSVPNPA